MKTALCVVAVFLLVLLPSFEASSRGVEEEEVGEGPGLVRRALRAFAVRPGRSRERRQIMQCNTQTDCLAGTGFVNVSSELVRCVGGDCICSDCFFLNDDTGICTSCTDYPYVEDSTECGRDDRPKQLTAFLLTLFLASTGAANFYIDQDGLAGGQLFLLLLLLFSSYVMCYLPCCMACCIGKEEIKGSVVFIVLIIILALVTVLASLAIWAWWIADVVIFATNQRLSGNGCVLLDNL